MNKESAAEFKAHILSAIRELSAALLVSQHGSDTKEFSEIRGSVGDAIAKLDNILREDVYRQHPDLNDL
jgi:hypothetical protein